MTPPTGRLTATSTGADLTLIRTFRAGLDDVWASITEPARTARWFGDWKGDPAPGRTVQLRMLYEGDDPPWMDVRIDECDPPHRLVLSTTDDVGAWHLSLLLTAANGHTELRLVHHLPGPDGVGEFGPGWEYYLDMLAAARNDTPQPAFTDYYPAMKPHYEALHP